ncbi:hypothetical protein [Conchiformibius steedae]|uniref:hypothetical protein n=1 Tax=Conchiformibius steedae TaxID=153493 RepID=UPI0026EA85FE|nr:hypothetical protein [Conchiformibius steedae]
MSSLTRPTDFAVASVFFFGNPHRIAPINQAALVYALFHSDSIVRRTNQTLLQASDAATPDSFGTHEILPCPTPDLNVFHDYLSLLYRQTFGTLHVCQYDDFKAAVHTCHATQPENLPAVAAQELETVAEEILLADVAAGLSSDVLVLKNLCDTASGSDNCRLLMRQLPQSVFAALAGLIGVPEGDLSEDDYLDVFFSHLIKMQELAVDYYRRLAGFTAVLPVPCPAATTPAMLFPLSLREYKKMADGRKYDVFLSCLATANTADLLKILPDIYTLLPAQEALRRHQPHALTLDAVVAQLVRVDDMLMTGLALQSGVQAVIGASLNQNGPADLLAVLVHVLNLYPSLCELILGNLQTIELKQQFYAFLNVASIQAAPSGEMAG